MKVSYDTKISLRILLCGSKDHDKNANDDVNNNSDTSNNDDDNKNDDASDNKKK